MALLNPSVDALRRQFASAIGPSSVVCGDTIVYVNAAKAREALAWLRTTPGQDYNYLVDVTAVEYRDPEKPLEVVYELFSLSRKAQLRVKVALDQTQPLEVDSVVSIWRGADWLEREVFDMFGIVFKGHPDLRRILMWETYAEGHPLRKSFPLRGRFSRSEQGGTDGAITGGSDETITTVAGNGSCATDTLDQQPATAVSLCYPLNILVEGTGALYIADTNHSRVRRVVPGSDGVVTGGADASNETITTVVGTGTTGLSGDGGPATSAQINGPWGLSFDATGNLLVGDRGNHLIRKVLAGANAGITGDPDETIATIAGNPVYSCGQPRDGSAATLAGLCNPAQILAVPGGSGDILIADQSFHRIRRVESATGTIRTEVGAGGLCYWYGYWYCPGGAGYGGEGSPARGVRLTATAPGFATSDGILDVHQSSFRISLGATTISGLSSYYSVGVEPNGLGCCFRLADDVTINVQPTDPTVLDPVTPLMIPNNGTSSGTQTLPTVGAGLSNLVATTTTAPINSGVSDRIKVIPTLTSISPSTGQVGTVVACQLSGTNLSSTAYISVSGTGVFASVNDRTNTSLDFTLTIHPLAEFGVRTITASTPGGDAAIGFVVTQSPATNVRLTDISEFQTGAGGASAFSFRHNTNPGDGIGQLGVTTPQVTLPSSTTVSFLNPGDKDINLPLVLGNNTFTMVAEAVTSASPFGLNLFFNDDTIPGISVYNANGGTGAFSIQMPEAPTSGEATGGSWYVPASGVASIATANGYSVTLTGYTMRSVGTPFVDLGSYFDIGTPNGSPDTVASMTLDVVQQIGFEEFAVVGYAPPPEFDALASNRVTIGFDEDPFPDGSSNPSLGAGARGAEITSQYSPLGVTFGTASGNIPAYVFGPPNVAFHGKSIGNNEYSFQAPIGATFSAAKSAVGLVTIDGDEQIGWTNLTAYSGPNGTGTALATVSSPGGTGNDPYFLGVVDTSGTPRIRSVIVRFQRVGGSDLLVDDFTFSGSSQ